MSKVNVDLEDFMLWFVTHYEVEDMRIYELEYGEEWRRHPKTFIEWGLQHGWKEHLTLERINVNGNYEPTNCKWIPMSEQYKNKQSNHNKMSLPQPYEEKRGNENENIN